MGLMTELLAYERRGRKRGRDVSAVPLRLLSQARQIWWDCNRIFVPVSELWETFFRLFRSSFEWTDEL